MKKVIMMLCLVALITGSCKNNQGNNNAKALMLLQNGRQITLTEIKLDSIFDFHESFEKKIEAMRINTLSKTELERFTAYGNSLSKKEIQSDEFQKEVLKKKEYILSLIKKGGELNRSAALIELKKSMNGEALEFIGWSCVFGDSVAYFNKDITEILAFKQRESE